LVHGTATLREYVSLGGETKCKVLGQGTICIKRLVDEEWFDGKLEDVLYVPNLSKNLFYIGAWILRKNLLNSS